NSVDFQHLRVLHGLRIECDPGTIAFRDHSVEYDVVFEDPNLGVFEQHVKVFGTNTITLSGRMAGADLLTLFSGVPLPGGHTRGRRRSESRSSLEVTIPPAFRASVGRSPARSSRTSSTRRDTGGAGHTPYAPLLSAACGRPTPSTTRVVARLRRGSRKGERHR